MYKEGPLDVEEGKEGGLAIMVLPRVEMLSAGHSILPRRPQSAGNLFFKLFFAN